MGVIIANEHCYWGLYTNYGPRSGRPERSILSYGTARNFCWIRNSGYFGKKTSAIKTLFGVRSCVAIVSLYSKCTIGLIKTELGFTALYCLSDDFVWISTD